MRNWRRHVKILADSVRRLIPDVEVYVFGGAAEDRLTVLSDIDFLVVVDRSMKPAEKRRLRADIIWDAVKDGFPWDYPIDIHIVSRKDLGDYQRYIKRSVKV